MRKPDWRSVLEPAFEAALEFLTRLPERKVRADAAPEQLLATFSAPLPEEPSEPSDVLMQLVRASDPGITAMPSGRFFGWVIGGALPAALAADWLVSAWDQNACLAFGTPAAAAVEQVALRDVLELLDLPRSASGALVTGAQMANTTCLAAARNGLFDAVGWDVERDGLSGAPKLAIVVGAERHDTVVRSLRLLGLGYGNAHAVAADDQGRMRPDALAATLATIDTPVVICAQAGNVNTGAIDPLAAICDVIDAHRSRRGARSAWLHVDGAFGLWARASRVRRALLTGVERADSWATDAHKWLNTPYDCGIALCADSEAHRRAMMVRAAYLPDPDESAVRSPVDWTPDFSRRARGFVVYAALRQLGRRGVEQLVDDACAHATRFATGLRAEPGVEVLNEVVLNQVLVSFRDPHGRDDDAHTRAVIERVVAEGVCYPSASSWRGRAAMRISVSNWSTDLDDVARSLESILQAHRGSPSGGTSA